MRFLILAHEGDETAALVAARLHARYPQETRLLTLGEITGSVAWRHSLNGGSPDTRLVLPDQTVISSDRIGVVFNRLRYVDNASFAAARVADHEYAVLETFAMLLSWLTSLKCPVINPVSPQGLGGPIFSALEWNRMAHRAGLPTSQLHITSSLRRYPAPKLVQRSAEAMSFGDVPGWMTEPTNGQMATALVVGDEVFTETPAIDSGACRQLTSLSGFPILLIHFAGSLSQSRWTFNGAEPWAASTDPAVIASMAQLLEASS